MKHTEHDYHEAGYRYERASTPNAAIAEAQRIRSMIEAEHPDDHAQARRLIDQGRQEARAAA